MSNRSRRGNLSLWVYGISIALHVGIAAAAVLTPKPKKTTSVAMSLFDAPQKKKPDAPKPPPPPPPPPKAAPKAKAAPAPVIAAAKSSEAPPPSEAHAPASSAMDGFADLGLSMGNGGGGGMAVAANAHPSAQTANPGAETTRKVKTLGPRHEDTCDEAPVKPKPKSLVKGIYTDEARAAQIEGVVRVEYTVDENGIVIAAKVLKGLGYGLDEKAIAAAKQSTFEPGTRCGKPAVVKVIAAMRFGLD